MTAARSFRKFSAQLDAIGLLEKIEKRSIALRVTLKGLYSGNRAPSTVAARRAVYLWLLKEGKSVNEVARLFDRAPSGVAKLIRRKKI